MKAHTTTGLRRFYFIDLFCGAGGTTIGIEKIKINSIKMAKVLACVNHNPMAIASHKANNLCEHFIEDIRIMDLSHLRQIIEKIRKEDPLAIICIWASPDCTGHSKAKGGIAKNPDSRSLPNALIRYLKVLGPDYLYVENVREFREWGPCDKNGRPIKVKKGIFYLKWKHRIEQLGYNYNYKFINAANHGAYTSRDRYFGIFAKQGLPIKFPEATHSKTASSDMFGFSTKPWKPVREVLDLQYHGKSIIFLGANKLKADNTYKRVLNGLIKFVAGGKKEYNTSLEFFIKYFKGGAPAVSIDLPSPTLTKKDRMGLINCQFLDNQYGSSCPGDINKASWALTKNPKIGLATASLINENKAHQHPDMAKIHKLYLSAPEGYYKQVLEFMLVFNIVDIKMRMLNIPELKRIQGFPDDYILKGTKTQQKMFIGNSVHPIVAEALIMANIIAINSNHLMSAA